MHREKINILEQRDGTELILYNHCYRNGDILFTGLETKHVLKAKCAWMIMFSTHSQNNNIKTAAHSNIPRDILEILHSQHSNLRE
jgi:hypothetical protein